MTDTSDFDWCDSSNIVIAEQPATAVHRNPAGDVVIRQRDICRDEDSCIFVRPENVQTLIDAMLAELGYPGADSCLEQKAPPLSNAERQRRHRANRKNQERNESNHNDNELSLRLVTQERAS